MHTLPTTRALLPIHTGPFHRGGHEITHERVSRSRETLGKVPGVMFQLSGDMTDGYWAALALGKDPVIWDPGKFPVKARVCA